MKYNSKLIEKYARGVPGEQSVLIPAADLSSERGYSEFPALSKHVAGMPVTSYRNSDGTLKIIQHDGLCHALVAGSTGCGKSMRYLETCLFNLDGTVSAIVADVKGELNRNTAAYLKSVYGENNVKYMDFIRPERSQIFFNPLFELAEKYLKSEECPEKSRSIKNEVLADLKKLFDKLFPLKSTQDVSWDEGARGFIYGIALGLFEDMFLTPEQERATGRKKVLPGQINFEALSDIFSCFEYGRDSFDDCGFFRTREKSSPVLRYVRGIIDDAPTTRACYLQIVDQYLSDYSYPDIQTLTTADNFDPSALGDSPGVIFLTYDLSDKRMRGLVNQFVIRALDTLKKKAVEEGKPLSVPVQFFLDEFPTLTADEIYPVIFSVGRGLNMYITAVVQDYTQLETSYSDGVAQQIRNNCNLTFFLGTNDINTAKAVKEQIGKRVIPDPASYLAGGIKFSEAYLVSEDELMHRLNAGDAYVTINNHMPVKGSFELYYDCPEFTSFGCVSSADIETGIDLDDKKFHYGRIVPKRMRGSSGGDMLSELMNTCTDSDEDDDFSDLDEFDKIFCDDDEESAPVLADDDIEDEEEQFSADYCEGLNVTKVDDYFILRPAGLNYRNGIAAEFCLANSGDDLYLSDRSRIMARLIEILHVDEAVSTAGRVAESVGAEVYLGELRIKVENDSVVTAVAALFYAVNTLVKLL